MYVYDEVWRATRNAQRIFSGGGSDGRIILNGI
jgi:hypothetical protein